MMNMANILQWLILLNVFVRSKMNNRTVHSHLISQQYLYHSNYNVSVCSDTTLEHLSLIIDVLKWSHVSVIYESSDSAVADSLLKLFSQKHQMMQTNVFDVTNLDRQLILYLLQNIHSGYSDGVKIIVLLKNLTFHFLQIVCEFDKLSNKTTDYQLNSRLILLDLNNTSLNLNCELHNMILLSCCSDQVYRVDRGRKSEVVCFKNMEKNTCSLNDFYPHLKFKFNSRPLLIGTIKDPYFDDIVYELTVNLAQVLNFTYTLVYPKDHRYGGFIDGSWRGLVGQLERREVDMVIAELTVTEDRLRVIDFILPGFLSHGIGVLYRKDIDIDNPWYKIFKPLHPYVYLCTLGTLVYVGTLLFLLDDKESGHNNNVFRAYMCQLLKVFIDLIGFLSIRGSGMMPKTEAAKVLLTAFWMFCLIITGVYVGNLTAKMTEPQEKNPFENLPELTKLLDWKWGINDNGITLDFLKYSKVKILQDLWNGIVQFNRTDTSVLAPDRGVHFDRILNPDERYAFLVLDAKFYALSRNDCALAMIDTKVISNLHLAIAVPKNSYLKVHLEKVMGRLADNGFLKRLEDIRYKDNRPSGCKRYVKNRSMHFEDVKGVLLIVFVGLGFSVIMLMVEFFWKLLLPV